MGTMTKKLRQRLLSVTAIVFLLLIGGVWYYFAYYTKTPEYALRQVEKALDQHDLSEADIVKLIKTADMEDGVKILNHIYGDEKQTAAAQKEVAAKTGLDAAKVAKIMAVAAPVVLTMLAKTNKKTNKTAAVSNSDGLADLLGGLKANSLHIIREGKLNPVFVHAEGLDDF